MKKNYIILLTLLLISCSNEEQTNTNNSIESSSIEESISSQEYDFDFLFLPGLTTTFSKEACKEVMNLCSNYSAVEDKSKFTSRDIEVLEQVNYSKINDESDTCAYTIGKKSLTTNGKSRDMFIVSIRGTNSKEWYSNFNFSTTKSNQDEYATNFYNCAIDVYSTLEKYLDKKDNPLFLVTGHSRGAATANILAKLLNDKYNKENVYAYTYATPNTGKTLENNDSYSNIFNLINPNDLVCNVPLESWGYHRFGIDIVLPDNASDTTKQVNTIVDSLASIITDVESYYSDKHSLSSSGLSSTGKTAYDISRLFVEAILGNSNNLQATFANISKESDYYPLVGLYSLVNSSTIKTSHNLSTYRNLLTQYK